MRRERRPLKEARDVAVGPPLVRFDPKTDDQRWAVKAYAEHDLCFFVGPAGTGKSHAALGLALTDVVNRRARSRVIVTKPIVEAGEHIGFLKGTLNDKLAPYMASINGITGRLALNLGSIIEFQPLAYLRGTTFEDCVMVLDEAQNCTLPQFRLFLSRMGKGSKVIVTGDPDQSDLDRPDALMEVVER